MAPQETEKGPGHDLLSPDLQSSQNRLKIAAVTLSILALLSSYEMTRQIGSSFSKTGREVDIRKLEERFDRARSALKNITVVGYLKDNPDPAFDSREGAEYFAAQYALAPVTLAPGGLQSVVLGNFHDPASMIALDKHLIILKDLGDGLFLFKNKDAKT